MILPAMNISNKYKLLFGLFTLVGCFELLHAYFNLGSHTHFVNLFTLDLLNINFKISREVVIILGALNGVLLYEISRKVFNQNTGLILSGLYFISPWTIYLELASSASIFYLFLILSSFISLINFSLSKNKLWLYTFLLLETMLFYTNFIVGFLIFILVIFHLFSSKHKQSKIIFISQTVLLIPLVLLIISHKEGSRNLITTNLTFFSDIRLINTANTFQGELKETKVFKVGKLFENKYTYIFENILRNQFTHLIPVTYFTGQYKLMGFSASTPIYTAFLIPFLFGLVKVLRNINSARYLILTFLCLTFVSVFSYPSPNLEKSFLVAPVIFLITSIGFEKFISYKGRFMKTLILSFFVLIILQITLTMIDIFLRDPIRYLIKI